MESEYLTPTEVAKMLRVTPEAVQTWCRQGKLKAHRAGRLWRITPADLQAFTEYQQQESEDPKKADSLVAFAY